MISDVNLHTTNLQTCRSFAGIEAEKDVGAAVGGPG